MAIGREVLLTPSDRLFGASFACLNYTCWPPDTQHKTGGLSRFQVGKQLESSGVRTRPNKAQEAHFRAKCRRLLGRCDETCHVSFLKGASMAFPGFSVILPMGGPKVG